MQKGLAARDSLERGVLPISDRKPIGLTTYDAKDPETKFPPTKAARQPTRENAMTSIRERNEPAASARQTAETLRLLQQHVPQQRRVVRAETACTRRERSTSCMR